MKHFRNALFLLAILGFASCTKKDTAVVSAPLLKVGVTVSNLAPLSGAIKGTLLTNQTYSVTGDVIINATDTLLIQ